MHPLIEKGRKSLHLLVGVASLVAGLMFLVASLAAYPDNLVLSLVMVAMGAFQVIAWVTRERDSSSNSNRWIPFAASRFGGGYAGIGIALLIFDRTNGWRIAMGAVFLAMGAAIILLSFVADRR